MDGHKHRVVFLQRIWDFMRKKRHPQRDLRDFYQMENR